MSDINKRKYPRIKISLPISYVGLDESENVIEQNMGVALDVSQNGMLIETLVAIESDSLQLMIVDHHNKLAESKGKVVYSRKSETGKYRTGLELLNAHEENVRFVKKLIKAYHYQKGTHA